MKLIGNILWVIFGGLIWSLTLFLLGIICCISIIFIPIGIQLFKLAKFVLWPFGKEIKYNLKPGKSLLNVLWAVLFGWEIGLGFLCTGVLWCITIFGIPFGSQYFKLAQFVFIPLGAEFRK